MVPHLRVHIVVGCREVTDTEKLLGRSPVCHLQALHQSLMPPSSVSCLIWRLHLTCAAAGATSSPLHLYVSPLQHCVFAWPPIAGGTAGAILTLDPVQRGGRVHCRQDVGCNVCCCSVHHRRLLPPNVSGWGRCLTSGLSTGLASRSY